MAIIDAQIHLWGKGVPTRLHIERPYLVDEAIRDMDEAGIDGAVIHPPNWDEDSNELALAAVRAHPTRFVILGNFPLDEMASRALVPAWKQQPGMLGLRFYFSDPRKQTWPMDGTMDWFWPAAEKAGLPVALLADEFLPLLGEIAARHPGLKLIVDHMGAHRIFHGGEAAFVTRKDLVALAKLPNVAVKLTGGPFYADDTYPFRSLHPHYRALYDAFGPRRLFWGTDITKMPCSWAQCVSHFREIDWIPEADKKLIMGDAICDWIGWKRGG